MKYLVKKLTTLIITLLLISFLSFAAFSVIPGDAALSRLGEDATEEQIATLKEELGLNDPLMVRYGRWLSNALHGDFGESYQYENNSVSDLIGARLPVTVLLAGIAFVIIVLCALPLGILCARFSGGWLDTLINQVTQIVMAVPSFFLGILLTYIFGLILQLFQPGNFISPLEDFGGAVRYLIFPAIAVALPKIAMVIKFLRNSVIAELNKDYVRTARSKGNTDNMLLYGHVLKNAMIPVITYFAMVVTDILAGSIVVEQVFSVQGMGRLLISSISTRDYPVVQAVVLYVTAVVVIINFIVDVLYQFIDPRVRKE